MDLLPDESNLVNGTGISPLATAIRSICIPSPGPCLKSIPDRHISSYLKCETYEMLTIKLSKALSLRKPGASMVTRSNPNRQRTDGRKSLLVYMDGALIKELKKVAVDEDCNAYEIVEEATRDWLKRRESTPK